MRKQADSPIRTKRRRKKLIFEASFSGTPESSKAALDAAMSYIHHIAQRDEWCPWCREKRTFFSLMQIVASFEDRLKTFMK